MSINFSYSLFLLFAIIFCGSYINTLISVTENLSVG